MTTPSALSARGRLTINHRAIADNFTALAALSAPGDCAAVIKANAYGMGALLVSDTVAKAGCQHFFVADAREGIEVRRQLPSAHVYLFDGLCKQDLRTIVSANLTPVLATAAQHQLWKTAGGQSVVWQIDSGMNRLGFSLTQAIALASEQGPPDLIVSHFSCADDTEQPDHQRQLDELTKIKNTFSDVPISLGNTAGIQLASGGQSQLSRCGIGLYGGNPAPRATVTLRDALALEGRVLQHREVPALCPVGYGATWHTDTKSTLLTVGLGYADGLPRSMSNRATVSVDGHPLPVVGRVSMDYLVVDATSLQAHYSAEKIAQIQWLNIFTGSQALDQIACAAGTISYELLTHLGLRIERVHVH